MHLCKKVFFILSSLILFNPLQVSADDHEAMLKRIRKKGKVVALESANKNYETKIFGPDRVKVQGVLVSLNRNIQ